MERDRSSNTAEYTAAMRADHCLHAAALAKSSLDRAQPAFVTDEGLARTAEPRITTYDPPLLARARCDPRGGGALVPVRHRALRRRARLCDHRATLVLRRERERAGPGELLDECVGVAVQVPAVEPVEVQ